jgi:opacity protein-like surface antigen
MGDAYEGLKSGPGLEAQFRITPSVWSFGFGVQGSAHSFDDVDLGNEDVTLAGLFFEPRRVLDVGSGRVAPYVSARLAYLRQSLDIDVEGTKVSASASGAQINGGGGVLVRLSPRVNLDLGATYGYIRFGDVEVDVEGFGSTKVDGTSGNGSNLVLRAGFAIGLK